MLTSTEERSLFYLLNNIITKLADKLLQINIILNNIISQFSSNHSKFVSIWEISICVIGLIFHNSIIASLLLFKNIIRSRFGKIFHSIPGEEPFMYNLSKYIHLLNNVCFEQFTKFENKKNHIITRNYSLISNSMITSKRKANDLKDNIKGKQKQSSKKQSIDKREINKEVKQQNENNEDYHKAFNKFMRLPILTVGILFSICGILCYSMLQIIVIIHIIDFRAITYAQNDLSSNFLMRIPKLAELLLYSIRSVLANDQYHLKATFNDYDQYIVNNYYNVTPDVSKDSYFGYLDESYFALLYYQYSITSGNIIQLQKEKQKNKILPKTIKLEEQINQNNQFCTVLPLTYIHYNYLFPTLIERLAKANQYTAECRTVYNGINLSGFQSAVDLLFNQFIALYIDYFKQDKSNRIIDNFLNSEEYNAFETDMQLLFKVLINTETFLIEEDIQVSIMKGGLTHIILGIMSISINVLFGCVGIFIFVSVIEQYNLVINDYLLFFVNSIRCNNKDNTYL